MVWPERLHSHRLPRSCILSWMHEDSCTRRQPRVKSCFCEGRSYRLKFYALKNLTLKSPRVSSKAKQVYSLKVIFMSMCSDPDSCWIVGDPCGHLLVHQICRFFRINVRSTFRVDYILHNRIFVLSLDGSTHLWLPQR